MVQLVKCFASSAEVISSMYPTGNVSGIALRKVRCDQLHAVIIDINRRRTSGFLIVLDGCEQTRDSRNNDTVSMSARNFQAGLPCTLPFQAFFVYWHLDGHVGKLVVTISPDLWRFPCCLGKKMILESMRIQSWFRTRIIRAVSLNTRQGSEKLEGRASDDDHEELREAWKSAERSTWLDPEIWY
jgi:hypothetical protein